MDDLVDDALLLVSELVTNAVVHAGTDLEVTVDRLGDTVEVSVADRYADRDLRLPVTADAPPPEDEHGRGLFLVRELSGYWGVEHRPDGKRVWFRLTSRRGAPAETVPAGPVPPVAAGQAMVAMVAVDGAGCLVDWRGDAVRLTGHPAADVLGRPLADLVGPTAGELVAGCARDGRWAGRLEVRHRDGGAVTLVASHVALDEPAGASTGLWVPEPLRALVQPPAPAPVSARPAEPTDDALARLGHDEYLSRLLAAVCDEIGADAAYVTLREDDGGTAEVRAAVGLDADLRSLPAEPVPAAAGRVDSSGLPLLVDDLAEQPGSPLAELGFAAAASVPVAAHGHPVGRMTALGRRVGAFDHAAATALASAAGRAAGTLEALRLAELERRRRGALAFLAESSDLLGGTLEPTMAVAVLGQLVVPRLADWCAVTLLAPGGDGGGIGGGLEGGLGSIVGIGVGEPAGAPVPGVPGGAHVWHADEDRIDAVRAFLAAAPAVPVDDGPATVARRDPPLRGAERDAVLATATDADQRAELAQLAASARLGVALRARGRLLGQLVVGRRPGRQFRAEEVGLLEDLARRAALAVDNARLFADQRAVAHALQASLLPPALPALPGIDVGVAYRAAGEGLVVGGDFYDVVALPDGRVRLAVGDVCGKGAEAAAVTGLARHTLRVLGAGGAPLPEALRRLNAAILEEGPRARFVTLAHVELAPGPDGVLTGGLCCAGHPPPMLLRADGRVEPVGSAQPLLGVFDDVEFTVDPVELRPGDTLVCYTDGVTERRSGGRMLGETGLAALLRGLAGVPAAAVADRLQQAVVGFAAEAPRDDLAVLVVRAGLAAPRGPRRRARAPRAGQAPR